MRLETLEAVADNQEQTTVVPATIRAYMSQTRVMIRILSRIDGLGQIFECDEAGNYLYHKGSASKMLKLCLPMKRETVRALFAQLSVDASLPKRRQRVDDAAAAINALLPGEAHDAAPAIASMNLRTVGAQTYGNYRSSLKFWHEYNSKDLDKVM